VAGLPQVSGKDLVKFLRSLGYIVVRRKGSHVRLKKLTGAGEHNITIPDHRSVAKGTLSDILSAVSIWNGIPKENLLKQLRG
jgi:predicted RNA binding protein YcfA (HicA-like mRNA interferase family)